MYCYNHKLFLSSDIALWTQEFLEDSAELGVENGVDNRVKEPVQTAKPYEQREDNRIYSADGANVEQIVTDAYGVADIDGKERNPTEQKSTCNIDNQSRR